MCHHTPTSNSLSLKCFRSTICCLIRIAFAAMAVLQGNVAGGSGIISDCSDCHGEVLLAVLLLVLCMVLPVLPVLLLVLLVLPVLLLVLLVLLVLLLVLLVLQSSLLSREARTPRLL